MKKQELERIKENFRTIEHEFDLIDKQTENSRIISKKTLYFYFDI